VTRHARWFHLGGGWQDANDRLVSAEGPADRVGDLLESRAYHPRFRFDRPTFDLDRGEPDTLAP